MRVKSGFTLIEMIVTVIILGILATIAFSNISWIAERGRSAEANEVLLKAYGGYLRILADEDYIDASRPLTWLRLGLSNPNANEGRFFDYSIDSLVNPTRVTAVRRTDSNKWLRISLSDGCITKTSPY